MLTVEKVEQTAAKLNIKSTHFHSVEITTVNMWCIHF